MSRLVSPMRRSKDARSSSSGDEVGLAARGSRRALPSRRAAWRACPSPRAARRRSRRARRGARRRRARGAGRRAFDRAGWRATTRARASRADRRSRCPARRLGELVPRFGLLGEPLELGAGLAVVGVELEGGAQRGERLLLVLAALFPELGGLAQDGDLLAAIWASSKRCSLRAMRCRQSSARS